MQAGLVDEDGALRLVIRIDGVHNYDHSKRFVVDHCHPVPITTYNEKTWRRWIFEQCLRTMNHEIGESLRASVRLRYARLLRCMVPVKTLTQCIEVRPETDALTTQDGTLSPRSGMIRMRTEVGIA